MNRRLDELWLDALETKVDGQVVVYLKKNHPDYQDTLERQEKLTKQYIIGYAMIWTANYIGYCE